MSNFSIAYTVCKKSAKNVDAFSKSSGIYFKGSQVGSISIIIYLIVLEDGFYLGKPFGLSAYHLGLHCLPK